MDSYISRILKNWAARHALPADGKERLLEAAKAPPPPVEHLIGRIWLNKLFSRKLALRTFESDTMAVPFTQSRIWSFHITTSIRFVA